ncbi:MAG: Clp1/GlmU family protein [bacterium]
MNKSTFFPQTEPETWEEWGPSILEKGGTVFLLGGVDTGKTYFARLLYQKGCKAGLKSAILELDVGQSEFGPPMTCTFFVEERPKRQYFIGRFSPQGAFWRCLTAAALLKKEAEKEGTELTIVDTTGLVEGSPGVWLKRTKIEILRPDFIIARERGFELEPILSRFSYRTDIKIIKDPVPAQVKRFSPQERAILREQKLRNYFKTARAFQISTESVALLPGAQFFERGKGNGSLVVGLLDGEGWLLALGILLEGGKNLKLIAPVSDISEIRAIEASTIRIFNHESLIMNKNIKELGER